MTLRTAIGFMHQLFGGQERDQEDVQKVDERDIIIVILGTAGAGKTSFIDTAVHGSANFAPQSLKCQTSSVKSVRCNHPKDSRRKIIFVDTPAFNHDEISPADIEKAIVRWMKQARAKKNKVAGILYLQKISDSRMTEPPLRHIRTFSKLCEGDKLKTLLVTTMWDEVSEETGRNREKQIRERYMDAELAPKIFRYGRTPASAWEAVDIVLEK